MAAHRKNLLYFEIRRGTADDVTGYIRLLIIRGSIDAKYFCHVSGGSYD